MPRRRFQAWRIWTHVDVTAGRSDRPPPPLNIRRQPCQTIFLARNAASISQAPKDPQHVTDTPPDPSPRAAQTDVHPVAIEVALAAALWFIAVTWVSFARGAEVDWDLVVVTLFFIFFFALFLFTASHALKDSLAPAQDELPRVPRQRGRHRHGTDARPRGSARDRGDSHLACLRRNADRRDLDRSALGDSFISA
jgi:hypothetical protein